MRGRVCLLLNGRRQQVSLIGPRQLLLLAHRQISHRTEETSVRGPEDGTETTKQLGSFLKSAVVGFFSAQNKTWRVT